MEVDASSTAPVPQSAPPKSSKLSCLLCQRRKIKCDRNFPCANCRKSSAECVSPTTLPPRPRKRRFAEAELLARLRRYEDHLRGYGADIDAINNESGSTVVKTPKPSSNEYEPTVPYGGPFSIQKGLKNLEKMRSLATVDDRFRDAQDVLQGSSDDESLADPIIKTYETIGLDGDEVIFGPQLISELSTLHPLPVHIFRLWQTFLDNVNPLTKIVHAPILQHQILDATSDLNCIPKNLEALMFSIYSMAITSLQADECERLFGEDRTILLSRYHAGTRQALRNAGFLRSADFMTLQAFLLYLLSNFQMTTDPRSLYSLSGIAVRNAQRIGLSSDGTEFGLLPYEVELRRRLWWQIVIYDSRVSELAGTGHTFLTYTWTTKLPSNLNDSDLSPGMKEAPIERSGPTEMIYVRLRCEIRDFVRRASTSDWTSQAGLHAAEGFIERIEGDYLQYCDKSIPLHFLSDGMTRSAFSKFRMGVYRNLKMAHDQKAKVFRLSLTMLEIYNSFFIDETLQGFLWQVYTFFPMPAQLYILESLRLRTSGDLTDRAWDVLSEFDNQVQDAWLRNSPLKESTLSHALAQLTLKAWDANGLDLREKPPVTTFISKLRQQVALKSGNLTLTALDPSSIGNSTSQEFPQDVSMQPVEASFAPSRFENQTSFGDFTQFDPSGLDIWQMLMTENAVRGSFTG